jgi:hypothetical protein
MDIGKVSNLETNKLTLEQFKDLAKTMRGPLDPLSKGPGTQVTLVKLNSFIENKMDYYWRVQTTIGTGATVFVLHCREFEKKEVALAYIEAQGAILVEEI